MVDHLTVKLGKKSVAEAPPDPRNLKLEDYVDLAALPDPIPDAVDNLTAVSSWPMYLNDQLGDCVIAAMAHQEEADSALNGKELVITDAQVLQGYEDVGGYVPGNPATDQGCDPQVALSYWQKTGLAGNKIGAYVSVDPTNAQLIKAANYLFGGLFIGLDLPLSAQNQQPWDVVGDGKTGRSEPGSWGGHMVYGGKEAASDDHTIITWGERYPMTQRFLATYSFAQTFAVIPDAWLNGQQQAPNGLKIDELKRDLAIVSGQPDPGPPAPAPAPTPTPPPFTPDPTALAWLQWQQAVCAYQLSEYAAGDVSGVVAEQTQLADGATWLGSYLAGQATKAPPVPPAPIPTPPSPIPTPPQPQPTPGTDPHVQAANDAVAKLQAAQAASPRSLGPKEQLIGGKAVAAAVSAVGS